MGEEQFWLWAEGDGVGWFSPWGTGCLEQRAVPTRLDLNKLADLRNGFNRPDIVDALAPRPDSPARAMAEALRKPLADGRRVRLQISRTLASYESANDWTRIPFEWLRLDGKPLHGRLLVERYVPTEGFRKNAGQPALRAVEPPVPLARSAVRVYKRLSDDDDKVFTDAFMPQGRLPRCNSFVPYGESESKAEFANPSLNLSEESALVLVCHGTETAGQTPFRLPDKSEWGIPHNLALPPLVVLLVCGSDAGNLLNYARDVLLHGQRAQTVIVSAGQLSIEAAAQFLRRFLEAWSSGKPVCTIVQEAQQEVGDAPEFPDARRLCVLGRGDLRVKPQPGVVPYAPPLDLLDDQELISRFREGGDGDVAAAALTALVNRTTLRCMLAGNLNYEPELRQRMGLNEGESLSAPLALCLRPAGTKLMDGSSNPERLWKVSEGWVLRAHDPEIYKKRYGEYEAWRSRLEYFPPPGFPGRERPSFHVQDLPSPIAEAWEKISQAMDQQDAPGTAHTIKDGFRISLRFIATVAAMDLLRSAGDTEKQKLDKGSLVGLLFGAKGGIDAGVWLDCLRIALQDQYAHRLLGDMRGIVFRARQSYTELMDVLSNEYEQWQEQEGNVFRVRTPELVAESLRWFARLQELLGQVDAVWRGWHFEDSLNHTRWHGIAPESHVEGHEHRFEDEFSNLEMIHEDGRRLDLSPLLSVQRCRTCHCGLVFFHVRRNGATGAEFLELREWHAKRRAHVPALIDFVSSLPRYLETPDSEDAERGEEDGLVFREFENFERPDYLFQRVRSGLNDLGDRFGAGYLHLIGPEGCGKTWFAKKFADQEVRGECILRCRVGMMGRDSTLGLIDHLSLQAQQQGLKSVDEARKKGLDEGGTPDKFSEFLRQLIIGNNLRRLTIILDGFDELPEPEKRKPLERTLRQRSSYRGSGDGDSSGRLGAEEFEMSFAPDDNFALDASALREHVAPSVLDALPPARKLPESCFILLIGRKAMGDRATEVIAQLRADEAWVEQRIEPGSVENLQVVRRYVQKHLAQTDLVDSVMERSSGVFLWAYHLIQALDEGAFRHHDILPNAGEFYPAYLGRLRDKDEKNFESVYLPLLLLLAAAQESVGVQQLVRWGMREDRLRMAIIQLRDFLSEQRLPRRFAIKHEGLVRYFKADPEIATRLAKVHAEIVNLTLDYYSGHWKSIDLGNHLDRYAVRCLPKNALASGMALKVNESTIVDALEGLSSLAYEELRRAGECCISNINMLELALSIWSQSLVSTSISIFADHQATELRSVSRSLRVETACTIIERSLLSSADKKLLAKRVPFAVDSVLDGFLDVASGGSPSIQAVVNNLRKKLATKGDQRKLLAIVKQEYAEIEKMLARPIDSQKTKSVSVSRTHNPVPSIFKAAAPRAARRYRASTYHNLGVLHETLRHWDLALINYGNAIELRNTLVSDEPQECRNLAKSLHRIGFVLCMKHRWDEAGLAYDEAIVLERLLIDVGQREVRIDLSSTLSSKGSLLYLLYRKDEACKVYDVSIALRRTLAAEGNQAEQSKMVFDLECRGNILMHLGRLDDALTDFEEATELLLREDRDTNLWVKSDLGRLLMRCGICRSRIGFQAEAVLAFDEAIKLQKMEIIGGNRWVRDELAECLTSFGHALTSLGHYEEAAATFGEAARIQQELIDDGRQEWRTNLAMSLDCQGTAFAELHRHDEAASSFEGAINVQRELVDNDYAAIDKRASLSKMLIHFGNTMKALQRQDRAQFALDQAAALQREVELRQVEMNGFPKYQRRTLPPPPDEGENWNSHQI